MFWQVCLCCSKISFMFDSNTWKLFWILFSNYVTLSYITLCYVFLADDVETGLDIELNKTHQWMKNYSYSKATNGYIIHQPIFLHNTTCSVKSPQNMDISNLFFQTPSTCTSVLGCTHTVPESGPTAHHGTNKSTCCCSQLQLHVVWAPFTSHSQNVYKADQRLLGFLWLVWQVTDVCRNPTPLSISEHHLPQGAMRWEQFEQKDDGDTHNWGTAAVFWVCLTRENSRSSIVVWGVKTGGRTGRLLHLLSSLCTADEEGRFVSPL